MYVTVRDRFWMVTYIFCVVPCAGAEPYTGVLHMEADCKGGGKNDKVISKPSRVHMQGKFAKEDN